MVVGNTNNSNTNETLKGTDGINNNSLLPLRTIHNMDQLGAEYSSCGLGTDIGNDNSNSNSNGSNNTISTTTTATATTLVVQTSIERMWILGETCSRWANDPIIAVVFVPHHDEGIGVGVGIGAGDDHDHAFLLDLLVKNENALLTGEKGVARNNTNKRNNTNSSNKRNNTNTNNKVPASPCPNLTLVRYNADRSESLPGKYPVNRLRNVGLDLVTTSHVLMMDVDFVPSKDLEGLVRNAISSSNAISRSTSNSSSKKKVPPPLPRIRSSDRTLLTKQQQPQQHKAFVVPAFEKKAPGSCSDSNDPAFCISKFLKEDGAFLPRTFAELQECYTSPQQECVVFQSEYNWDGHSTTLSDQWMKRKWYDDKEDKEENSNNNKNNPQEKRFRRISCFHTARYEPYVILEWCPANPFIPSSSSSSSSLSSLPPQEQQRELLRLATPIAPYYDERFYGYGKNKIELVSHLRRSNYQFEVLPEGFLVHNPHPESSTKELWLNKHDRNQNRASHSDLHSTMDALYSTFLGELDTKYKSVHKDTIKLCSG